MACARFGKRRWRRSLLTAALWAGLASAAQAFEASVLQPAFTVSVPALPAIPMAPPPAPESSTRLGGSDSRFDLAISADDAHRPITPRECAGAFLRVLVTRPGMPPRDSVYRAPLNEALFLVIYILDGEPGRTLHAHLLSTAASTHCVEAHFSRAMQPGEEEDAWRRSFTGASITDGAR